MRSGLESAVRVAVTGTLLLALAGCGGDSPVPPMVVVTPEPVRGVIAQTAFSGFQSDVWISIELILSQRGVLDITVDWTYPDTWMYVYFGRTNCDYTQLASRNCPFILSSETKSPKPRVLYTEALDPGSDNTESVALQLGLTVSASGQRSTDAVHLGRPIVVSPPRL
jgi:hypothetical protein